MKHLIAKALTLTSVIAMNQMEWLSPVGSVIVFFGLIGWMLLQDVRRGPFRTPGYVIYCRAMVPMTVVVLLTDAFVLWATGAEFLPFWGRILAGHACIFWFFFLARLCVGVGAAVLVNDVAYQQAKKCGHDPLWDILPPPLNFDSPHVRQYGVPEGYQPPKPKVCKTPPRNTSTWKYCCPECGVRVQHAIDVCWNCGYGEEPEPPPLPKKKIVPPPLPSVPIVIDKTTVDEITEEEWFVPPNTWKYRCPECQAAVQLVDDACWKCEYVGQMVLPDGTKPQGKPVKDFPARGPLQPRKKQS